MYYFFLLNDCAQGGLLTRSPDREEAVDFSTGVVDDLFTLVAADNAEGSGKKANFSAYLGVFAPSAWALVAAMFVAISIVYAAMGQHTLKDTLINFIAGLRLSFLAALQLQNEEGEEISPDLVISSRSFFLTVNLSFFFFFAAYSSDLTAAMTAGQNEDAIASFQV